MRFALVILLVASTAVAEPLRWKTTRGFMQPGRRPGSFILATDAVPGRFSDGEVISEQPVTLPYRLDVTWQRLGPEAGRSMHVTVGGGVLLIRTGMIALYAYDEVKFAADGWTRVPGLDTHAVHSLGVVQDREKLVVSLAGKEVARFVLAAPRERAFVGVGMKGATGFRSTIYVRSLAVALQ